MPIYEFRCNCCGKKLTKLMKMSDCDVNELTCECGETASKVPSLSGFELKGGGWYGSGYTKGE